MIGRRPSHPGDGPPDHRHPRTFVLRGLAKAAVPSYFSASYCTTVSIPHSDLPRLPHSRFVFRQFT
jgi:hypothetical protein